MLAPSRENLLPGHHQCCGSQNVIWCSEKRILLFIHELSSALLPPPQQGCVLVPGSGPCRPASFQPAAGDTDWGEPRHRCRRPARRCSCHTCQVVPNTGIEGSPRSHSGRRGTLGRTYKHKHLHLWAALEVLQDWNATGALPRMGSVLGVGFMKDGCRRLTTSLSCVWTW